MPRTEDDTWDLVSSVGATATMVAAQRAAATRQPNPLIVDLFAEPLVVALGVDYFIRYARGQLDDAESGSAPCDLHALNDSMAIRTRYFDDFSMAAADAGIRQVVILTSGLDSTTVFETISPRSSISRPAPSPNSVPSHRWNTGPWVSTCATTGRRHYWRRVSMRGSRRPGSRRDC